MAVFPFVIVSFIGENSALGLLFPIVAQLIPAVGAGIVLIYVISGRISFAENSC